MKREIDLFAKLNKRGYIVGMTINGKRFVGKGNPENGAKKVSRELHEQIESVYGDRLMERYWVYRDIRAYLDAAINIAKDLDRLLLRTENAGGQQ